MLETHCVGGAGQVRKAVGAGQTEVKGGERLATTSVKQSRQCVGRREEAQTESADGHGQDAHGGTSVVL